MKTRSVLNLMSIACLSALTLQTAAAQSTNDPYYYLGLSGGQTMGKFDEQRMFNSVVFPGASATSFGRDEKDTAFKIFTGYQFNRNWGMELGYFDLGKYRFNTATLPVGNFGGELKVRGVNLNLVGTMPLSDNFSVFAKAGAGYARSEASFNRSGAVVLRNSSLSTRKTNLNGGVGLQYAFNPSFQMRAEYERFIVSNPVGDHGRIDLASVSLIFPFGRTMAPKPMSAEAPYVAPAPAPAPIAPPPVAVAPPPAPAAPSARRVSFSAESLFSFDRADITADGRQSLDKFTSDTRGSSYDMITVEGHTDRLGSSEYNQRLSERRAEAVKNYLVSSDRLEAAKINSSGKGETMPVTKPEDCVGRNATKKLIACLAPDRRVDVVVNASVR